jgi:hypothetical protein
MQGQRLLDFAPMRRRCNGAVFGGGVSLIPVVQGGFVPTYGSAGHDSRRSGCGASLKSGGVEEQICGGVGRVIVPYGDVRC